MRPAASSDCTTPSNARQRVLSVTSGRVPVGALREATWMLALAGETRSDFRAGSSYRVPDGFALERAKGETIGLGMIGCSCGRYERHAWSWMREKKGVLRGQVSGTVRGHGEGDAMEHAFALLAVAEAAEEKGCAPALPPARVAWGSAGIEDADSEDVRLALVRARPASRACAPRP